MREFRLIFAQCNPKGRKRTDIADRVSFQLAQRFGGFTLTLGTGGFQDSKGNLIMESVFVFDCATDQYPYRIGTFARMIARMIKREMNQESVYFRNVNGRVKLI